jgi:hypothetical protein
MRLIPTHNVVIVGILFQRRRRVDEVMRGAVDAQHERLLERPGRNVARELGVAGLDAPGNIEG